MSIPKVITRSWLKAHNACLQECERFSRTFPNGARVSRVVAIQAAQAGLRIGWLSFRLLSFPQYQQYQTRVSDAARTRQLRGRCCHTCDFDRDDNPKSDTVAYEMVCAHVLCDMLGLPDDDNCADYLPRYAQPAIDI